MQRHTQAHKRCRLAAHPASASEGEWHCRARVHQYFLCACASQIGGSQVEGSSSAIDKGRVSTSCRRCSAAPIGCAPARYMSAADNIMGKSPALPAFSHALLHCCLIAHEHLSLAGRRYSPGLTLVNLLNPHGGLEKDGSATAAMPYQHKMGKGAHQ